jgi:hypothetical protein
MQSNQIKHQSPGIPGDDAHYPVVALLAKEERAFSHPNVGWARLGWNGTIAPANQGQFTELSKEHMRYFVGLFLSLLLGFQHANACRGPDLENNLFFEAVPDPKPEADLIAIVSVSTDGTPRLSTRSTATVIRVLKTSDTQIKPGDKIAMQLWITSCGPFLHRYPMGDTGMIIAKVRTDNNGRPLLHPYTHRAHDEGRVTLPNILPDGFDMSPKPLQVREVVPKNFAVILIGINGTGSADYLYLNHSARPGMLSNFPAKSNAVVAIAIPVGFKQLSISQTTVSQSQAGIRTSDTVGMQTPKLDIDRPGIYYMATLDTNHPGQFQTGPNEEQLKVFRAQYRDTLGNLQPINFEWPSQQ